MNVTQTPLKIILNPPDMLEGFPGETVELHVVVINQGHQGAVIDVFFDQVFQALSQWCPTTRERLALDPQQSGEVTFRFDVPIEALPGTYDYTLVVDAPEHYPEETPVKYGCQLKVLRKEQTVIRFNNPTFALNPPTNPERPVLIHPGVPLQMQVLVNNRSNRVDRFRLACLDLDEDWFKIKYSPNQLGGAGLVSETAGLELNPGAHGQIVFELLFPPNMPAGNYTPTLRLYSANAPDLVLLDVVYLQVPSAHQLKTELVTILGKVSRRPGHYQLRLINQGNLLRELTVQAQGTTEEELCRYTCDPSPVQLLIGRETKVDLTVQPLHWWRRPLFGRALELPFQVKLEDLNGLPVPEKSPQATLLWKARPWWQFLLVLLAGLGTIGSLGFLIWFFFFKPAPLPKLTEFKPDSLSYTEGGKVLLNWTIDNADQVSQLTLTTAKDADPGDPKTFDLRQGIPSALNSFCSLQQRLLTCANFNTGATQAGKYTFKLQIQPRHSEQPVERMLAVEIKLKPLPQVQTFESDKSRYQKGDRVFLKWQITNFSQLATLNVIGKDDNGVAIPSSSFTFNKIPLGCQPPQGEKLSCDRVGITLPPIPGGYTLQLQPISNTSQQPQPSTPIKVLVAATPPKIVAFTLNGATLSRSEAVSLKAGQTVTIEWQVQGDDTTVKLEPIGNVPNSGAQPIPVTPTLSRIALTATNKQGQSVEQAFLVQVQLPPSPSPSLSPNIQLRAPRLPAR